MEHPDYSNLLEMANHLLLELIPLTLHLRTCQFLLGGALFISKEIQNYSWDYEALKSTKQITCHSYGPQNTSTDTRSSQLYLLHSSILMFARSILKQKKYSLLTKL